jgi:hypothetical protein
MIQCTTYFSEDDKPVGAVENKMDQRTYIIKLNDVSTAEANVFASELRDTLLNAAPEANVSQRRDNPLTQDFGTTLVLLLGTSSLTAIAKAIGNWLQLHNSVSLTIEDAERKIIAQNITRKELYQLTELFLTKK